MSAHPDLQLETGRKALVFPDWDDAYHEATQIRRMIRSLAERLIHGASGENEDADLFA